MVSAEPTQIYNHACASWYMECGGQTTTCKELNAADNPVSLEGDPSPVKSQVRPQP